LPLGDDPASFNLAFCRGLDILMLYRAGHPFSHVTAARAAIESAGANLLWSVALPGDDQ